MANEAEQAIYQRLASAPLFHPASVELLPEDWGIETGDVVSVKSGEETYNVPVYSHTLVWNGKSKATIESTGNQEREPLPELRRKEYQQGHATYTGFKANKQEIDDHWQHVTQVTDKGMSDSFGIIGVKIGADGMPMKDASGNYIWDDSGTGGEIWGHLNRSAWTQVIQNHIQDANGNILSIAQVLTSADGQALIQAINDQQTGTAQINANRIHIQSTSGSGIELDQNGNISLNAGEAVNRINGQSGSGAVYLNAAMIHLNGTGIVSGSGNGLIAPEGWFTDLYAGSNGGQFVVEGSDIRAYAKLYAEGGIDALDGATVAATNGEFANLTVGNADVANAVDFIGPATASGGQITIPWTRLDGTSGTPVNFNIAATQYYIDGVAAAYERGKSEGSSSSTNIDLANSGQIYLHTADPGSGYTNLGSLGSKITEGKSNGSAYVSFQATCDGGKTYKYYKIPL